MSLNPITYETPVESRYQIDDTGETQTRMTLSVYAFDHPINETRIIEPQTMFRIIDVKPEGLVISPMGRDFNRYLFLENNQIKNTIITGASVD